MVPVKEHDRVDQEVLIPAFLADMLNGKLGGEAIPASARISGVTPMNREASVRVRAARVKLENSITLLGILEHVLFDPFGYGSESPHNLSCLSKRHYYGECRGVSVE